MGNIDKKINTLIFTFITVTLWGCASSRIYQSSYISPSQFEKYKCDELLSEITRIQTRVSQFTGKSAAETPTNDKWILGSDLLLSWAALSALGGTREQEAEYIQLKNDYDALQRWAMIKKCPGVIPSLDKPPEFDPDIGDESRPDRAINGFK